MSQVDVGCGVSRRASGLLAGRALWGGVALGILLHAVVFAVAFPG